MEILFQPEGTPYQVQLEFADTPTNIGEEIREMLKEKYIQVCSEEEGTL